MAIRGRKPKPIAVRRFEGNPGKRPLTKRGGKSGVVKKYKNIKTAPSDTKIPPIKTTRQGIPLCPAWLNETAKSEWRRITPHLKRLGLLQNIDRTALAGYCQAYARWVEAEKVIEKHGTVYKTKEGNIQPFPQVSIAQKYLQICKNFIIEFGMTPSSRGRMTFPGGEEEEDAIDKIIGEK